MEFLVVIHKLALLSILHSTKDESFSPHGNVAVDDEEDSLYLLLHQTLILLLLKILLFAKIN